MEGSDQDKAAFLKGLSMGYSRSLPNQHHLQHGHYNAVNLFKLTHLAAPVRA